MPRIVEEPLIQRPAYFWWVLANALALCFAVVSWTACLTVFGSPEVPRNYEILRKIGRLPELKRYTVLDVPDGSLLDPKGLYSRFFALKADQLKWLNSQLMRNYLTNFERPLSLTYIEGDYQVEAVRKFGKGDFIQEGFAIRARAMVKPDDFTKAAAFPVVIEYVFPTTNRTALNEFLAGDILTVKKSPNCAAIVHVEKILDGDDQSLCLTVIPIAYGACRISDDVTFTIDPPKQVSPAAGFPVFRD